MRMVSRSRLPRSRRFASVILVVFAGCNAMNGTMNNEVGKNFYKAGNYTMAKDEFQRAVINDPDDADYIGRYQGDGEERDGDSRGEAREDPARHLPQQQQARQHQQLVGDRRLEADALQAEEQRGVERRPQRLVAVDCVQE